MARDVNKYLVYEFPSCEGCPLNGTEKCEGDTNITVMADRFRICPLPTITHVLSGVDLNGKNK